MNSDLELFGDTHKHVAHDYRYLGRLNKRLVRAMPVRAGVPSRVTIGEQGRYDEALEALSKARDIERKLAPGPTVRLAACIGDLGALHYEMGHFEEVQESTLCIYLSTHRESTGGRAARRSSCNGKTTRRGSL